MIDKNYCMSSYLAFRYIERDDAEFKDGFKHIKVSLPSEEDRILVRDCNLLDNSLKDIFDNIKEDKLGLLLSGGMDSACLATYMPKGSDAYTFRFEDKNFAEEELRRAELFAEMNDLNLHYVDISFEEICKVLPVVMSNKGEPVHSIEPQIFIAAKQAKKDGVNRMIIGDAADYVFYGMDGLLSRDWLFEDFVKRSMYINPVEVLKYPTDIMYLYNRYKRDDEIDYIGFYDKVITEESYGSYKNAFESAELDYYDPYENFKLADPLDLERTRNGESKYFIRDLFRMKYPDLSVPEKYPMPRPVEKYFKEWKGPIRQEFRDDIDIQKYSGNQKWQIFCLEQFLNMID